MSQTHLIIGVGNDTAGDDAAGRLVVRQLASLSLPLDVTEAQGDATGLMALFENRSQVTIIDACLSGAAPGTIHKFDASEDVLPSFLNSISSHGMGVAAGIELARTLGCLPKRCEVFAIEGKDFTIGSPVSEPVETAIAQVADEIARKVAL